MPSGSARRRRPRRLPALAPGRAEREPLARQARETDAGRQLQRCFPRWGTALEHLRWRGARAPGRRRAGRPQRPRRVAQPRRSTPRRAAPPRHHRASTPTRLTIARRRRADRRPGRAPTATPAWTGRRSPSPPARLDAALRRAHAAAADRPRRPARLRLRATTSGARSPRRLGLADEQADDLSRWALAHPDAFDADDLRCWRIASATLAARSPTSSSPPVERVERPVGAVRRARRDAATAGSSSPVLSLDAIRLIAALGGRARARPARRGAARRRRRRAARARQPAARCTPGPRSCLDSAGQLAAGAHARARAARAARACRATSATAGAACSSAAAATPAATARERAELALRVVTFPAREFTQRRLGAAPRDERYAQPSAVMELGEAVQTAVERGLPLLLSTEAAGQLKDTVRVGRMKGRPGMLTITTADGVSAPARAASSPSRRSPSCARSSDAGRDGHARRRRAPGGAHDAARGRSPTTRSCSAASSEIAALKVVGSGVDASQVGTGKTITTGRALAHRAATTRALPRAGRRRGPAARPVARRAHRRRARAAGCRRWRPTSSVLVLDDRGSIAGQIRALRPRARRAARRRARRQRRARPPPRRAAGDPVAPADRRRGAALRQPRHRRPPGARAGPLRRGRRLLAADRHAARQERRAPRRARRARASATRR